LSESHPGKNWNRYYQENNINWENKAYYTSAYLQEFVKSPWMHSLTLNLKPKSQVLDAGCGTGLFSIAMAWLGHHVTAIDYNQEAVDLAKSNLALFNQQAEKPIQVDFRKGDLLDLIFADGSFDLVFNQAVLEYFVADHDLACAVSEMHRVTRVGGQTICIVQHTGNPMRPWWKLLRIGHYANQPMVRVITPGVLKKFFETKFSSLSLDGLHTWKAVFMVPKFLQRPVYYLYRFCVKLIPMPLRLRVKFGLQIVVKANKTA
jgi:SAM-dependent methyltransferase